LSRGGDVDLRRGVVYIWVRGNAHGIPSAIAEKRYIELVELTPNSNHCITRGSCLKGISKLAESWWSKETVQRRWVLYQKV